MKRLGLMVLALLLLAPSFPGQERNPYQTIQEEGTALTRRPVVNFIGGSFTCVDNPANNRTNCTDTGASGAVATDVIWDAAGDLAIGTGADTAVRLAIGAANTVLFSNGTTAGWDATPAIDCTDCTSIPAATELTDVGDVDAAVPADGNFLIRDQSTDTDWENVLLSGDIASVTVLGAVTLTDGASTRTNLGLAIGTDVQAFDAELLVIAGLAETNGNVMFVAGGAWTSDATPAIDCTDCTNIPAGSTHSGTVTWSGTAILESGTAFQFGDGTDATVTHTYGNTGTDVTIAYSTAAMAVTAALTATSYGGITEANLVDKGAAETMTGTWTFDDLVVDGVLDTGTLETFVSADTTPDVGTGSFFISNATAVTITDFDGAGILAGQFLTVESGGATTYDCTTSGLQCGSTDIVTATNDFTSWIFDGTDWHMIAFMDQSTDMGTDGTGSALGSELTSTTNDLTTSNAGDLLRLAGAGESMDIDFTTGTANEIGISSATGVTVIDFGTINVEADQLESDIATGTAPLVVASTTVVTNLNADLLDGNTTTFFAAVAGDVFTGVHNFGGATSIEIVNAAAPTVDTDGEIALDTTGGGKETSQLLVDDDSALQVFTSKHQECKIIEDLAAADDGKPFLMNVAWEDITLLSARCGCIGTCTTEADISFDIDQVTTATESVVTGAVLCEDMDSAGGPLDTALSVNVNLDAADVLTFDVDNAVSPETDDYVICVTYEIVRK